MKRFLAAIVDFFREIAHGPRPVKGEPVDLSWPPKRERVRSLYPKDHPEYNKFWTDLSRKLDGHDTVS